MPDSLDANASRSTGVAWPVWMAVAAAVLAIAIVLHGLLPRYTFTTHGNDGAIVLVFDRWTGQFQRAVYQGTGDPIVSSVVRPF